MAIFDMPAKRCRLFQSFVAQNPVEIKQYFFVEEMLFSAFQEKLPTVFFQLLLEGNALFRRLLESSRKRTSHNTFSTCRLTSCEWGKGSVRASKKKKNKRERDQQQHHCGGCGVFLFFFFFGGGGWGVFGVFWGCVVLLVPVLLSLRQILLIASKVALRPSKK